ncbi:hypothetical protein BCR32DRAFT_269739 [Anaeromyces robustus]|uniref:Uncharacterized protein n=1 Tax=Anaeromyces robustus TaxID=1754192 RepID=A0A1Y1X024_9FUNG|nr:hypothetical protein BCR32DRAFT_269739 [Anaeromyces robustus]|eukprot:ORX78985.1 hypothetical protein BCR32DRAFT_269739 [Anaeromyces robustus]
MKMFILSNYSKERIDIINLIKNNDINELKNYFVKKDFEFKDINDEDFNIIRYSIVNIKNGAKQTINYIITHDNKRRGNVIDRMITNDIIELKNYIENNNIIVTDLNDKCFNITTYAIFLYNSHKITCEIKEFIMICFDINKSSIISLIQKNEINKLINYIERNNIVLENFSYKNFDIIKFCYDDANKISYIMKYFVISHYTKDRFMVVELLRKNDIDYLKKYIEKRNIELKNLSDNKFDLIKYCDGFIYSKIKNFVISHYTKERYAVVELIMLNDIEKLKNYIEKNNINFKALNDNYFNIIEFCNNYMDEISSEMNDFIVSNCDDKQKSVIEFIKSDNIEQLKCYLEKEQIELKQLNNKRFNLITYINSLDEKKSISKKMKYYIINHYNKTISNITELISRNNYESFLHYIKKNNIVLETLNEGPFDIVDYCLYNRLKINYKIKDYIYKSIEKKYIIQKMILKNYINELKYYTIRYKIEFKAIKDNYPDMLDYYNHDNISILMKQFIMSHWDKKRMDLIYLVRSNNISKLRDLKEEIKNYDDEYFNIREYCTSLDLTISHQMKVHIVTNYNNKHGELLNIIKNTDHIYFSRFNLIKDYTEKFNIEFKDLNNKYFNIIDFCNDKKNKISDSTRLYIINHYDKKRGKIVDLIEETIMN